MQSESLLQLIIIGCIWLQLEFVMVQGLYFSLVRERESFGNEFIAIDPKTVARAVEDQTNESEVQKFIDGGIKGWDEVKTGNEFVAASFVHENFNNLENKYDILDSNSMRFIGEWDATEQVDFSGIELPVKRGYVYKIIGTEQCSRYIQKGHSICMGFCLNIILLYTFFQVDHDTLSHHHSLDKSTVYLSHHFSCSDGHAFYSIFLLFMRKHFLHNPFSNLPIFYIYIYRI